MAYRRWSADYCFFKDCFVLNTSQQGFTLDVHPMPSELVGEISLNDKDVQD